MCTAVTAITVSHHEISLKKNGTLQLFLVKQIFLHTLDNNSVVHHEDYLKKITVIA